MPGSVEAPLVYGLILTSIVVPTAGEDTEAQTASPFPRVTLLTLLSPHFLPTVLFQAPLGPRVPAGN